MINDVPALLPWSDSSHAPEKERAAAALAGAVPMAVAHYASSNLEDALLEDLREVTLLWPGEVARTASSFDSIRSQL